MMKTAKLSVQVKQSFGNNTSKLGALQSMRSLNSNSSKGILPVLNRYPSPTLLEPIDPEQERKIKEYIDISRFQGYEIQKRSIIEGLKNKRREVGLQ